MKIAAVVVTFNRLELLKESINSLREQTHKFDEIIVINNSSTDGTLEWINEQKDLTIITQENSGSSGGQHTGIKYAFEKGYDWIWCMDDDLSIYPNCISTIMEYCEGKSNSIAAIQPLKHSNSHCNLNHGAVYIDINNLTVIDIFESSKINKFFYTNSFCFEGVLLNRKAIELVGYPRRDFFITNDDVEYALRMVSKLPDYRIILLGEILMSRLLPRTHSRNPFHRIVSVTDWDIFVFHSYFRNFFVAVRLNYPNEFKKRKACKFLLREYKWILKVLLSILLFHSNKLKKYTVLFNRIILDGIFNK